MSLKKQTISGLSWSFLDNSLSKAVNFIVGIILARLLSPEQFGLVGMLIVFISVSQIFITSGFGHALIRKTDCTNADYSTVFYFNIVVSLFLYLILFFAGKPISKFYNEPLLIPLLKLLALILIFNASGIVQQTLLMKEVNFRRQAFISVASSIASGSIGIYLAIKGFGVWSLVWKTVVQGVISSGLLWLTNKWRPQLIFSRDSFRNMFAFGSKLLISSLLYTVYINIYQLFIGKFFNAVQLGYYTRADQFQKLPSSNISSIIQKVTLPVLSNIQNDKERLKRGYKKMIKVTMFVTTILMFGMAATASQLIETLIGPKWLPTVPFLQILCFVGVLDPLHSLNLNVLFVYGRSDLGLKLEVIKLIIVIPALILGYFFGLKIMLLAMIGQSIIGYFINSYWSGKLIGYSAKEQLRDIFPGFLISSVMAIIVYVTGAIITLIPAYELMIQLLTGAFIIFVISATFKVDSFLELKEIIISRLFSKSKITDIK